MDTSSVDMDEIMGGGLVEEIKLGESDGDTPLLNRFESDLMEIMIHEMRQANTISIHSPTESNLSDDSYKP